MCEAPAPALTRDCELPEWTGGTWRDLAVLAKQREEALRECTARMRAIRTLNPAR